MPAKKLQMVENARNKHLNVVRFVQIKINGDRTCDQAKDDGSKGGDFEDGKRTPKLACVWGFR